MIAGEIVIVGGQTTGIVNLIKVAAFLEMTGDSHIPTAPAGVCILKPSNQNPGKETLVADRFTSRLQAHSSMRKMLLHRGQRRRHTIL
jgi:hypothetical protein